MPSNNKCIACGATERNSCDTDEELSFFSFPKKLDRQNAWKKSLLIPLSENVSYSRVCSKHFTREDFRNTTRKLLTQTAVPRLSPNCNRIHNVSESRQVDRIPTLRCYFCGHNKVKKLCYFRFPIIQERRQQWLLACNIDPLSNVDNLFLCSRHFKPADLGSNRKKMLLHNKAIPSQFLEHHDSSECGKKKSYKYCAMCRSRTSKSHFRFPKDDMSKSVWMKRCDLSPSEDVSSHYMGVCKKHFTYDDFANDIKTARTLRLKKTAVPRTQLEITEHMRTLADGRSPMKCINELTQRRDLPTLVPTDTVKDVKPVCTSENIIFSMANKSTAKMVPLPSAEVEYVTVTCTPEDPTDADNESISSSNTFSLTEVADVTAENTSEVAITSISHSVKNTEHSYGKSTPAKKRVAYFKGRSIEELRKNIRVLQQSVRRSKIKITTLEETVQHLKQQLSETTIESLLETLPEFSKHLLSRKINKQQQYAPELQQFSLTLYSYSPRSYDYVRKSLGYNVLPHPATVRAWRSSNNVPPEGEVVESTATLEPSAINLI